MAINFLFPSTVFLKDKSDGDIINEGSQFSQSERSNRSESLASLTRGGFYVTGVFKHQFKKSAF